MTKMLQDDDFAKRRTKIIASYHRNFPNQEKPSKKILKEWRSHLALFLNQSEGVIEDTLLKLYNAYQSKNIECCLEVINSFPVFPGYPFMDRVNFIDHINYVCHYLGLTTTKAMPKVPFFPFQKTASSFINVVLCRLFDVIPTVLSFNHIWEMPAWVNGFKKWGGVVHDHYHPTPTKLALLHQVGIKKCVIHLRHPMGALISSAFHAVSNLNKQKIAEETICLPLVRDHLNRAMENRLRLHGKWLRSWRNEASSGRMEILETTYEEMKSDELSFFKRILAFYQVSYEEERLKTILQDMRVDRSSYNFRKAKDNEWENILTTEQINRAKEIIKEEFPDVDF